MDQVIEIINKMKNEIADADKVLIGLGKEFEESVPELYENNKIIQGYYLYDKCILNPAENDAVIEAYKKLYEIIKDKDYYILTLSIDEKANKVFDENRVVSPCGNLHLLQCNSNCNGELLEVSETVESFSKSVSLKVINMDDCPVCPSCGDKLVFNTISANAYNENGYLEKFANYKKWLQTTINKKLVMLELGVGMRFPTVIRLPFDKMCYYNQKCSFYRVHETLYQHTAENKERGIAVKMSGLNFLQQL